MSKWLCSASSRKASAISTVIRAAKRLQSGWREPGKVVLQVRDQGRGLPGKPSARDRQQTGQLGVGIAGMQERLRQLGGKLEVSSSQRGTAVRAVVPLNAGPSGVGPAASHASNRQTR